MVQDEDEEAGTRIYTAALGRPGRVITGASSPNSSQPFRYNSELGFRSFHLMQTIIKYSC